MTALHQACWGLFNGKGGVVFFPTASNAYKLLSCTIGDADDEAQMAFVAKVRLVKKLRNR